MTILKTPSCAGSEFVFKAVSASLRSDTDALKSTNSAAAQALYKLQKFFLVLAKLLVRP